MTLKRKKKFIDSKFFKKYGFNKPVRFWCNVHSVFKIYYKIEGYDSDILVVPVPQIINPAELERLSTIESLEYHHVNDFQIYINSMDNHITTFNYESEIIDFMIMCKCPLSFNSLTKIK